MKPDDELPQHVNLMHTNTRDASFVRLRDGTFQRVGPGEMLSLLTGHEYILANERLSSLFRELAIPGVTLKPAVLFVRATGQTWRDYSELICSNELTPEILHEVNTSGLRAWHSGHSSLFVSPQLHERMITAGVTDLNYSPGFTWFAARP